MNTTDSYASMVTSHLVPDLKLTELDLMVNSVRYLSPCPPETITKFCSAEFQYKPLAGSVNVEETHVPEQAIMNFKYDWLDLLWFLERIKYVY